MQVPFQLHVIVGPVDSDSVAHVIAKKAADLRAAAVVMAQHSKGRLKELWIGSVTKNTIGCCRSAVAVVPHA